MDQTWIALGAGLVLLIVGGDTLVRGAATAARRMGVSPLVIGLTLVGFGTSSPELVTSLAGAFAGSPGIAVGNIVGSNISNALLILGAAAAISPLTVHPGAFRRDGTMLALATAACAAIILHGRLERPAGLAMVAALVLYIVFTLFQERRRHGAEGERIEAHTAERSSSGKRVWPSLLLAAVGIGLTIVGARLLVDGAIALAHGLGVSDTVIGLTVVALGTSLPELVTSVVAALRRHGDVAVGNVVGSNLYNILGILGTTGAVAPLAVPAQIARVDVWVMVAATALMLVFARSRHRIGRGEGLMLLLAYGGYIAWLALTA